MRFSEITESGPTSAANEVWEQTKKTHEALRKLRSKEAKAADARASAAAMPSGPERTRRLASASRQDADARARYGADLGAANAARAKALAKSAGPARA